MVKKDIPDSRFELHRERYPDFLDSIRRKQTPRFFYKYMSEEGLFRFLSNGKILFAKADMMNDPFEFAAKVDPINTYDEWISFLNGNQIFGDVADYLAKMMVDNPNRSTEIVTEAIKRRSEIEGVLCLSTKRDHLLMWSHYAESHKGACLCFDITKDMDTFFFPKHVDYDTKLPEYNYLNDKEQACTSMFHKSIDWEYEDEYRVLKPGGYGLRKVKEAALDSIILGCRFDEKKVETVREELSSKGYATKLIKAVQSKTEYKLDFVRI